jgi:AcrR family transcriptional regulator
VNSPQRARSAEAKRQRERDILDAARSLAEARSIRGVTLTDIAAAVGMHKSAMLRYFETREQIFLALAAEGWQEWSGTVRRRLAELPSFPPAATPPGPAAPLAAAPPGPAPSPAAVASVLARTLTARPLFCDLLAHAPMNLERNVTLDTAYRFKRAAVAEARAVADALAAALQLSKPQAIDAVATATGMAGALWQMTAAPGSRLSELYERYPELAHAKVVVEPRLTAILTALLAGMRSAPAQDDQRAGGSSTG